MGKFFASEVWTRSLLHQGSAHCCCILSFNHYFNLGEGAFGQEQDRSSLLLTVSCLEEECLAMTGYPRIVACYCSICRPRLKLRISLLSVSLSGSVSLTAEARPRTCLSCVTVLTYAISFTVLSLLYCGVCRGEKKALCRCKVLFQCSFLAFYEHLPFLLLLCWPENSLGFLCAVCVPPPFFVMQWKGGQAWNRCLNILLVTFIKHNAFSRLYVVYQLQGEAAFCLALVEFLILVPLSKQRCRDVMTVLNNSSTRGKCLWLCLASQTQQFWRGICSLLWLACQKTVVTSYLLSFTLPSSEIFCGCLTGPVFSM